MAIVDNKIMHPWIEFDVVTQQEETRRQELQEQHAHLCYR